MTYLELADTAIGDVGLAELVELSKLQELHLEGTRVTREGIETLQEALPQCQIMSDFNRD